MESMGDENTVGSRTLIEVPAKKCDDHTLYPVVEACVDLIMDQESTVAEKEVGWFTGLILDEDASLFVTPLSNTCIMQTVWSLCLVESEEEHCTYCCDNIIILL